MFERNQKTIFVLDHTRYFSIASEEYISMDFLKGKPSADGGATGAAGNAALLVVDALLLDLGLLDMGFVLLDLGVVLRLAGGLLHLGQLEGLPGVFCTRLTWVMDMDSDAYARCDSVAHAGYAIG